MSKELVVIGATGVDSSTGAAYLFNLDGTEVKKLTPGDDGNIRDFFGGSVAIDEKVVVGTFYGNYFNVFSREGTYERTITRDDCAFGFGYHVATLGNLIVASGIQSFTEKLFIYTIAGDLLKEFESDTGISDVAISEQFIVSTGEEDGKTLIYSIF